MRTTIVRTGIGCLLVGPLIAGFEIVAAAGTPGEPAPPGTPFVFGDEFSATEWTGTVLGFVDLERGPLSEGDPGRCVGIIGTLVPTVVEGLTSSGYSAPPMSVVADGRAVESFDGLLECDYQPLVDAGYGLLFEASVMVGVTYPFVEPVFLAGDSPAAPELIAVGDTSSGDAMYYEPTALPSLPPLPATPPAASTTTQAPPGGTLLGSGTATDPAPVGEAFAYSDGGFSGTEWSGTVLGLVDLGRSQFSEHPGRCVGVVGTLVPTATDGLTSDSFSAPPVAVVAGGRAVEIFDSLNECDYQKAIDAGYGLPFDAAVTVGTPYSFIEPIFLAGDPAPTPELIAVGDTSSQDATYFQATMLPALPPAAG